MFLISIIILITAPLAFDASTPQSLTPYIVMLVIFIAACTMIGTFLGVFVKSHSKLTMLSGIMFPVNMLSKTLEYIGMIFPATWGFINLCNRKFEFSSILPIVIIFTCALVISVWKIKQINKI
ncbi:ABC-2 type transport system permease protein [Fontibacillus panacisegetis]|uniref:ABC-2 type transport system permease protein n=1 Tax=Fontibacillus panacisegetis TaxID=670482 RepID=A0A1G7KNQ8_9BACL|nr:ABC-2 type transport system permease protein [Fontibacillus panacisegetis]